ncbi:MAG: RepB family plasmid replication initiator protein [Mycoplasmoidaceae bacterium]
MEEIENIIILRKNLNAVDNRMFYLISLLANQYDNDKAISIVPYATMKKIIKSNAINLVSRFKTDVSKLNEKLGINFLEAYLYNNKDNVFVIYSNLNISMTFNSYLKDYDTNELQNFLNLKSRYAQTIYEIFKLIYPERKTITINVDKLKELLMEDNILYGELKKSLDRGITELQEKKIIDIKIIENKEGRKVKDIKFIIDRK